jgi:cell division protein FtsL
LELLFYTWVRVESTQTVFRISRAQHEQKESKSYNQVLSLEKARLISPERISEIARSNLNLSVPRPDQIIYVFGEDL